MTNPGWLDDFFAGLMMAVAAYSAGRLVVSRAWSRPTHRDVDVAHVLMGTAMAGMLVSGLNPIPVGAWEVVFSLLAAWFVWKCYVFFRDPGIDTRHDDHVHRISRRLIHLVMAGAMLYMYLAAAPAGIGSGGSMAMGAATGTVADFTLVPMIFILALLASGIWQLDAIGRLAPRDGPVELTRVVAPTGEGRSTGFDHQRATTTAVDDRAIAGAEVPSPRWLAPRLEAGSHIVMCFTMAYMLVLML